MIGATSGFAYRNLVGENVLREYPIPNISLSAGNGQYLLDIGCNWGRWSLAAAKKGYVPIGIDPSLGAIMAARRVARQLGLPNRYVVADARELPFKNGVFDVTYSYSVLQHLSKSDVKTALGEVRRVLKSSGMSRIQMAHRVGVRSLQHQLRRGFREPQGFEVRYWGLGELRNTFSRLVGPTTIDVDCFFGLGFQLADYAFMRRRHRPILLASEVLRRTSKVLPFLVYVADSVFCRSRKQ
jgi:SAM-dependent methyltransferase